MTCAECGCSPLKCNNMWRLKCDKCVKIICCCKEVHGKNNFVRFFHHIRSMFAAALGIEILCISAALIGENGAYYFLGYNLQGIILGYIFGYTAAGVATFMTILGRYDIRNTKIDSCCSVLEQQSSKGFLPSLITGSLQENKETFYWGLKSKNPRV
jgi:hypothetical protein